MKNVLFLIVSLILPNSISGQAITNGLTFDGIDTRAVAPHNDVLNRGTGEFTMEAWIKSENAMTPYPAMFAKRDTSTAFSGFIFAIKSSNGTPWMQIDGTNYFPDAGPNLLDNECHHVAICRKKYTDRDSIHIYTDGILVGSQAVGPIKNINNAGELFIGSDYHTPYNHLFEGDIKEIRIWDYALSGDSITLNMNNLLSTSTPGLIANYRMNEGLEQTIYDNSTSANDGVLGISESIEMEDPSWISTCPVGIFVGIDEEIGTMFDIFPNPTNGLININGFEYLNVELFDLTGRLVKKDLFRNGTLDISELNSGTFILRIQSNIKTVTLRVLKY